MSNCDCDSCRSCRPVVFCSTCGEELDARNIAEMDATKCETCYAEQCAFCGLPGNEYESVDGDKVCVHCANGHQRVKWFASDKSGTPVHGPCNCEVL